MSMTTYKIVNRNKKIRNIKKAALIKYELQCRNLTLSGIAKDLQISNTAIYRSINDLSKISRVDEWISEKLGLEI